LKSVILLNRPFSGSGILTTDHYSLTFSPISVSRLHAILTLVDADPLPVLLWQIGQIGGGAQCVFALVSNRISNLSKIDTCNYVHIDLTSKHSIAERGQIDANPLVTYFFLRCLSLQLSDPAGKNVLQIGDLLRLLRLCFEPFQRLAQHRELVAMMLLPTGLRNSKMDILSCLRMQKLLALGFRLREKPDRASHRTFCFPNSQEKVLPNSLNRLPIAKIRAVIEMM